MADNLDDDEYRIPLPLVERAGLADGATKAASLLPIDVMDSIVVATTNDDNVDEEVIIDLERLLLLFV